MILVSLSFFSLVFVYILLIKVFDMTNKKKQITISMEQQLKVLEDIKVTCTTVVIKYNVDKSTIRRIKRNAAKILKFADKSRIQKRRQRIRKPLYEELDQYLLTWFKEKKTLKIIYRTPCFLKRLPN